jgi:flagellar motor component MotA
MKGSYIAALIIVVGVLAFGLIVSGANFLWYVDLPSLVMVFLPAFVLTSGVHGVKGTVAAFSVAFGAGEWTREELEKAFLAARSLGRFAWLAALVGSFIGAIAILGNLGEMEKIGGNTAVALICAFYAVLFEFLVVSPMTGRIKNRIAESDFHRDPVSA